VGHTTDPVGRVGADVPRQSVVKPCDICTGDIGKGDLGECRSQMLIKLLRIVGNGAIAALLLSELRPTDLSAS
jgi:hypothetical protein